MSSDALARAREIAAKLSGAIMSGGPAPAPSSELGKRKNRWGEDEYDAPAPGLGSVKRKKLYIPVREYPDINFLGLLIGPKGITQKQLQDSTGSKIFIRGRGANKDGSSSNTGHPDDNDELHVAIEGSDDAVERASKQLEQILYNPQEAQRLKQEQLRKLAEMNNAAAAGVETIYGGGSGDSYQVEIRIPNNMVGLVIGKGGENILRLQAQLNVHAQIAKESEMKPGETQRSIVLKGHIDNVNEAKRRVEEIVANQIAKLTGGNRNDDLMDHAYVVRLPVPNDKVGIIIGKGGQTIKTIQEKTKTTVKIPHDPDADNPQVRTINIGADSKEALDACQMEIFLTLQMQQQSAQLAYNSIATALNIPIPDDRVGVVIGKGGATIKEIQTRLGVKVQIPHGPDIGSNPPVRTISIVGPPDAQQMAKYEIETIAAGNKDKDKTHEYTSPWASGLTNPLLYGDPNDPATAALYSAYQLSAYYDPALLAQLSAVTTGITDPATLAALAAATAVAPTAATAAPTDPTAAEVPTDPTAYYNDFWYYASYYGEKAARVYYGAWSPPEGTNPPEGYTIPPDPVDGAVPATTGDATTSNSDAKTTANTETAENKTESAADSSKAAANTTTDEASTAAWEAYQKQYAEWYEAYGKAAGADPNPPSM